MKNLLILLTAVLLITSCATQKNCERKFPTKETIIYKDSVVYTHTTEYRDTLLYIEADTSYVYYVVQCDTVTHKALPFDTIVKSGKSTASISIKKGKLKVECKCEEEKLLITKLRERIEVKQRESLLKQETKVIREPYIPDIYKYSLRFSILMITLGLGFVIYKLRHGITKLFS